MGKTSNQSTSSSAASPVRTSAAPAKARASRANARAFGPNTPESFVSYDPGTRSWKTSRRSSAGASTEFLGTWPRSGMMRSGMCSRRQPLAPRICVSGLSLLPTPAAIEGQPVRQYLRREETWQSTGNLTARLIGMAYGLRDRDPRPPYRLIAAPSFVEWMMGVPIGWTDLGVSETASRLLYLSGQLEEYHQTISLDNPCTIAQCQCGT